MRRSAVSLQVIVATTVLVSLHCTADAFAPAADRTLGAHRITSSRIRPHNALSNSRDDEARSGDFASQLRQSLATIGTSAAIFAAVLTSPINIHVNPNNINTAPMTMISIERSEALALTENQQFVADAWFAVTAQFFDQTFNGLGEDGWRAKEKEAMQKVADTGPDDDLIVEDAIKTMLSALGDPYTRFLPREKYEALTAYATGGTSGGNSAGIGVQLLEDPRTKNVVVMTTITGSPAAAAGVQAGDAILKVNGENMEGATAEVVAAKCRGEAGGKIDVDFLRRSDDGKAVKESTEHVTLTRAKINPIPIEASTFVSDGGKKVGLLKVPSFSTETVTQIVNGLRSVSGDDGKIDAIAIDLRGNVGGYMPAGVDAAKLFLPARAHIIAEVGKPGSAIKAYDADGIGAETSIPLYLLVDKRTASAAEIFAAALQDNQRALVVGTTNTFGKGRIQNVQPLENGSGVAVTRARYVTPKGRDLHGVGIIPDKEPSKCEANDSARTCLADLL
mmetsp:Transcript_13432/g.29170  ORF Transcript_13432/g.29170 Transcript_13432/m.29170 type:complete len:506 (+) Transcript_13432:122-1639(+)|eukprot:CAMPEP_0172311900 /NCGR_PEP_ID=MMETSP1058-20130122/15989_1 /TAXON_ID=83371 /ORGANISM="Detonula confervacea, Strain CCMP 353" /LENGTH=505 /DNA_ID=CAMNT_0013025211 /DNA_START=58 /DNA_END=1572 /DNA_ORIENTATION=-